MYRKDTSITMKTSASALSNNLSVFVVPEKKCIYYCIIHKALVTFVTARTNGTEVVAKTVGKEPTGNQGTTVLLQAKWVNLPDRPVLVLTSSNGIQIYDAEGNVVIFWYALVSIGDGQSNYGKGIAGVGNNIVCVGTEKGDILLFEVPTKGNDVKLVHSHKAHDHPIFDLASSKDILASSDDRGDIYVWKLNGNKLQSTVKIAGAGSPCSSLALWQNVLVGGYSTGHIRVFNLTSGDMSAEVTAHARWINAVDVAQDSGMVLSVSDDSFFRIWRLTKGSMPKIEFLFADNVPDVQLVGGKFVDSNGRALCMTGYDSNKIFFFVQNSSDE